MDAVFVSLVSAGTALVASVAGPLVALRVARRQFGATVLSTNRQQWINGLRDLLAELMSQLAVVAVLRDGWVGDWHNGLGPVRRDPALLAKIERLVLVHWKIRLLLNPAEADHRVLCRLIDAGLDRVRSESATEAEVRADIEGISRQAQGILKREWQRVKRGN
jgi:hypothetical protein